MERHGETPIKYLSISEMFVRIDKLRTERETLDAQAAASPDYVGQFEAWAAEESGAAPWRESQQAARTKEAAPEAASRSRLTGSDFVWIGDDMAVHLEAADPADLDASMMDDDAGGDRYRAKHEPWRDAPTGFLAKWGIERYALGATALGIIALIIAGTALRIGPADIASRNLASMANQAAGHDPYNEIFPDDNNLLAMAPTAPEVASVALHRQLVAPAAIEERVHQALADQGFWDIGVSAGNRGDVYLAGDVYSMDEAKYVMLVARHAAHAASVFFLHPDVQAAQGPAYLGTTTAYAPSIWGAQITDVAIGSPAYMAGVRAGDVIRGFDGKTIADALELRQAILAHQPGQRIRIRVWRDNANQFLVARLETRPATQVAMR
ncbi:MAG: PDZ domain-containing protein [Candidatus Binataceae bacterium]